MDGRYSSTRFVASYVGFAPLDKPRLAAIIVINEPQHQRHGGQVAAPAFKQLMERALIYLRVPQDQVVQPDSELDPQVPVELAGASGVSAEEEQIPIEALEDAVLTLIQTQTADQRNRTEVAVPTSPFQLPDFTGLSLREVSRECTRLGLRLKVTGSGVAVGQRPPPNSMVSKDMICEVYFSSKGGNAPNSTALRITGPQNDGAP